MRKVALMSVLAIVVVVGLTSCSDVDYDPGTTAPTPPTGSLELTIVTTGQDLDADGYTATIDCGCFAEVEVNDVATMAAVEPGSHLVMLTGIAANCELEGPNPRWIDIEVGEKAKLAFSVACHGYR